MKVVTQPAPALRANGRKALTVTTQAQDVAAATPPLRRRIVGYNPGIAGFAACGLLGVFAFSWGLLASPPNDASNLLNVLPLMCLLVTMFCLLGTCRLIVDPAGFIEVIDPLVVRRVPVSELVQVEHDEGLRLRVVSGRRIGSVAYGSSLLGFLLHYPRSVRAARRIEAAIGGLRDSGELPAWQQDTVASKLRVRAYLVTLGVNVLLVVSTTVINATWTAAQH
jgi:hypothetical protein